MATARVETAQRRRRNKRESKMLDLRPCNNDFRVACLQSRRCRYSPRFGNLRNAHGARFREFKISPRFALLLIFEPANSTDIFVYAAAAAVSRARIHYRGIKPPGTFFACFICARARFSINKRGLGRYKSQLPNNQDKSGREQKKGRERQKKI